LGRSMTMSATGLPNSRMISSTDNPDRKADGQRRDQRQQRPHREELHAGDHRHVIPGHRELYVAWR
jgi:hypothetical protein